MGLLRCGTSAKAPHGGAAPETRIKTTMKKQNASTQNSNAKAATAEAPTARKLTKIGLLCDLLDAAKTPAPLTMGEIIAELTKAAKAGHIQPTQNDKGPNGFNNPQTKSSINAMAVPSWSRHQGRLFRYAKTTQQGEAILNTTKETIQGIKPGERMTNTTLAHAFGPHAKAPVKMTPEEFEALPGRVESPIAVLATLNEKAAAAAKAAAKAEAEKAAAAKAAKAPKAAKGKAGAPKGGTAEAPKAPAPARKRAAKAPVTA